jgi:hypothetical protein
VITELANLTLLTHSAYSTPKKLLAEYLVYAKDDSRTILRQALIICGASTVTISLRSTELKSMWPSMRTPGRSSGFAALFTRIVNTEKVFMGTMTNRGWYDYKEMTK